MSKLDTLQEALGARLGSRAKKIERALGELTVTVAATDYLEAAALLRDEPELAFEQLIDLCGVDYSSYRDEPWEGPRYCVVSHLLSLTHNWRVRLKAFCADDDVPQIASLTDVWSGANWYEREASSTATSICAASSPTTASSATRCARTFRSPARSRCVMTPSRSASSTSR